MQISFYATLRGIVGAKNIELSLPEKPILQDVLDAVLRAHHDLEEGLLDGSGRLSRHVHLFVDGRSSKYLPEGMQTRIGGHHKIEFFPAVAGG